MKRELAADRPTRLFYQSTVSPAVGGVTLAGHVHHGAAVPAGTMRVYGRFAVAYLVDGAGAYSDASGLRYLLSPGDLIVVFPELAHQYGPTPGHHWSEFYIAFEGPVFEAWRTSGLLDPARPRLHLQPIELWLRRLESVVEQASPMAAMVRMQQFLADAIERDGRTHSQDDRTWLAEAHRLLDAMITDNPPRAEEVAERLGLSYELFRKKFAKLTGLPPAKFRDARLIDRASQLLQNRQLPLKQIALQCGFCDEFHFSRRFKQKIGLSPSEYRQRLP